MKAPLDPEFLDRSRKLRKPQTDAEMLLWNALRNRQLFGLKFRRQYIVMPLSFASNSVVGSIILKMVNSKIVPGMRS